MITWGRRGEFKNGPSLVTEVATWTPELLAHYGRSSTNISVLGGFFRFDGLEIKPSGQNRKQRDSKPCPWHRQYILLSSLLLFGLSFLISSFCGRGCGESRRLIPYWVETRHAGNLDLHLCGKESRRWWDQLSSSQWGEHTALGASLSLGMQIIQQMV